MAERYKIPTVEFLTIWKSMIGQKDTWRKFVIMCFNDFQDVNVGFYAAYKAYDGAEKVMDIQTGVNISDEDKFQFLSEKAYAKAMSLRAKMIKKNPEAENSISLPDGYKSRGGKKKSKRVSTEEMLAIMLG